MAFWDFLYQLLCGAQVNVLHQRKSLTGIIHLVGSDAKVQEYAAGANEFGGIDIVLFQFIVNISQIDGSSQYQVYVEGMYHLQKNHHNVA